MRRPFFARVPPLARARAEVEARVREVSGYHRAQPREPQRHRPAPQDEVALGEDAHEVRYGHDAEYGARDEQVHALLGARDAAQVPAVVHEDDKEADVERGGREHHVGAPRHAPRLHGEEVVGPRPHERKEIGGDEARAELGGLAQEFMRHANSESLVTGNACKYATGFCGRAVRHLAYGPRRPYSRRCAQSWKPVSVHRSARLYSSHNR